jgi:acetoacetyl-CoA reductase/3-oxoacyl-[acyl-carrier protein] reductase
MSSQIANRVVLVTGASRGIGHAIATKLLEQGYLVACGYRTHKSEAVALAKKYPNAYAVPIDIGSRGSVTKVIAALQKHYKQTIDIVVNNAGVADEKPFETLTDADWDEMLKVNLRGAFIVTQEALPAMRAKKWGRVVNIVSIGGQWGGMRQVHYAAAKAGLINFTHSMAKLYSKDGITSNAVAPGLVATQMIQKELRSKAGKQKAASIPIGRLTTPEEIAATVAFLVSDDAASITGQTINVNGGLLFS